LVCFRHPQPFGTTAPRIALAVSFLAMLNRFSIGTKDSWPATGFLHFEDDFSKGLIECWRISSMPDL
jgi:hypothetical protein